MRAKVDYYSSQGGVQSYWSRRVIGCHFFLHSPISVGYNNIGDEGAHSIAEGVKNNHSLTQSDWLSDD